ncbi:MAG: BREX-3 system P-loop-containing protein BrxF [Moorellales bacterium]
MSMDLVIQQIDRAAELYYRLVLVVAPAGKVKTRILQEVHGCMGAPLFNVSLELSRRLLDFAVRQRALRLPRVH